MQKRRIQLLIFTAFIIIIYSGCAATQGSDSLERYKELKSISVADAAGVNDGAAPGELPGRLPAGGGTEGCLSL